MTTTLDEIKEMLIILNKNVEKINEKVNIISKKLDEEIIVFLSGQRIHHFLKNPYIPNFV